MHKSHIHFLVAILLLSGAASALSENSTAIREFAVVAVPQGQQFSIQPFPLKGSNAFAVATGSEVYGIFVSGLPVLESQPLTAPDEIESALAAYYLSQGYSPNISFTDVHNGLVAVMANREKGEAKCRILTGTDRTPCTSFESCQKACYSVTSFCLSIALGSGRPFVDEIWKFENNSRLLDSAYLNESTAYSALQGGVTPESAKAYLNALIGVNRAATAASKSALYDGYSYCFEPDYALPVITNMQLTAQKRYALSEPFFTLSEKAKLVRSRTLVALDAASAQEKDAEAAQAARDAAALSAQNESGIAQNASELSPTPQAQPDGSGALLSMAFVVVVVLAGIAGVALYMKGMKKGK